MQEIILFLLTFLFIFLIYQIFIITPAKKRYSSKSKKDDRELLEIKYLEYKYNLDIKRIKYSQLLQICAIVSSLDISIMVTLLTLIDGFFLRIFVAFIVAILLIFISYHLVYLFYKKRGLIKNGKHK